MEEIAEAAQIACLLEVSAPKPGNVNRLHNFKDTRYEDFLLSAVAIGGAFREVSKCSVGEIILKAIVSTRRYVTCNTNLGMVLLFAPVAKAYALAVQEGRKGKAERGKQKVKAPRKGPLPFTAHGLRPPELRAALIGVLNSLTVEDARHVYAAIRLAHPGGIGKVAQQDIHGEVQVSLLEAMALAAHRDAIAREYAGQFEITFNLGYPTLKNYLEETQDLEKSIVQTYLTLLSEIPDTLIARKEGLEVSKNVSARTQAILREGGVFSAAGQQGVQDLDKFLRSKGNRLNPGTTADLTASALLVTILLHGNLLQVPGMLE